MSEISAIRRCRKQVGLSQQAIADALGVKKASVCGWETGRFQPGARHAIALTRLLRCLTIEAIYEPWMGEGGRAYVAIGGGG